MMKALQAYNQDDLNNLANKAKIVSMQDNKRVNQDYTLTKKSVVSISNSFVGIQNEFNKIVANITDLKVLQDQERNTRAISSNDTNPVASRITGAEQFGDSVNSLGKIFETLTELFKKLDLKTPETTQPETGGGADIDIDVDRRRGRGSRRTRGSGRRGLRGRGLAGKALGIFGVGLDATDRLSSGEDVAEAAVGVAGGVAGGIGGAKAGAALGALGGPAALLTVPLGGLIGGALGYLAGGFIADKAYDAVAEPPAQKVPVQQKTASPVSKSSTDRRLESAIKTATAVPPRREPSEIGNNSYSSRFANYLSDVFENVKGYIGGIAGAVIGATVGNYSPVGDGAGMTGNSKIALDFFMSPKGGGYTLEQAAGIVGNLQAESGANLDHTADTGDGGNAYGIAQWNRVASPDRVANFEKEMGVPLQGSSFQQQLEFVTWELGNSEKSADKRLRATTNTADAAAVFDQYYERSDGTARAKRIANARAIIEVANNPGNPNGVGLVSPVPGATATSQFGPRNIENQVRGASRNHKGIDFGANLGTPILAAGSGTVTFAGRAGSAGNMVTIDHGDGIVTRYMHMQDGSIAVRDGAQVNQEQMIGRVGSTGRSSGPHLHFEVIRNGRQEDPRSYLNVVRAPTSSTMTPSRASLMANQLPLNATNYFEALRANPRRGNGSLIFMPSAAPAQQTMTFPYRFGQTPPRQPNANPRGAYPAYHGQ